MSGNYYHRIPSPISHQHNDRQMQNVDLTSSSNYGSSYTMQTDPNSGRSRNEFENREKYMETQLTEDHLNYNSYDQNANLNEAVDDEPYPPPGLRRLVTGQTVSIDDDTPLSPSFDRVVPGEGNSLNNNADSRPSLKFKSQLNDRFNSGLSDYEMPQAIARNPVNAFARITDTPKLPSAPPSGIDFFDSYLNADSTPQRIDGLARRAEPLPPPPAQMPPNRWPPEASGRISPVVVSRARDQHTENAPNGRTIAQADERNFRKAGEGSSDNLSYPKQVQSVPPVPPNYDFWYSNTVPINSGEHSEGSVTRGAPRTVASFEENAQVAFSPPPERRMTRGEHADGVSTIYDVTATEQSRNSPERASPEKDEAYASSGSASFYNAPQQTGYRMERERPKADASVQMNAKASQQAPYRKVSAESQKPAVQSSERGVVPGAQSTPNNQPMRKFVREPTSGSFSYDVETNDQEYEENSRYSDSDEKPRRHRMADGYNSNTVPTRRKHTSKMIAEETGLSRQYSYDGDTYQAKDRSQLALGRRTVVGETSARRRERRPLDDEKPRRLGSHSNLKPEHDGRYRQPERRRHRQRVEEAKYSDEYEYEDEYDELGSDRGDRYREIERPLVRGRAAAGSRASRRERESIYTMSQDDSYYEDDDYDCNSYRNLPRYRERRLKNPSYRAYDVDRERSSRARRPEYYDNYDNDSVIYLEGRHSRPSSRSGSDYRRNNDTDYATPRWLMYYKYLIDHEIVARSCGRPMEKREAEYWWRIRDTNPQKYVRWYCAEFREAYGDWYTRYVAEKVIPQRRGSGGSHGIRDVEHLATDKLLKNTREPSSIFKPVEPEPVAVEESRSTPVKFARPHVKGFFNALGQLVVINVDQDSFPVEIYNVLPPDDDDDTMELICFTGPFIVGETHVNTISDYLKHHAEVAETFSEKLLYLLVDLIIKLRGVTDGIAISELLMNMYDEYDRYVESPTDAMTNAPNATSSFTDAEVTRKYTNLLLAGNKNAALEWAIANKAWGHAFLLASKMGTKYYSNVLGKFDSSIAANSPLKTLYQLLSGQKPHAATACVDEKWGDWIPHLAMILSNPTANAEFDKDTVVTLGDSLNYKNIFASHFCYLAAQLEMESLGQPSSRYCLLGEQNSPEYLGVSATNHSILFTQTYEFAKKLQNKNYMIPSLLPYKYLLVTRLIDYGRCNAALQYLESIANDLMRGSRDLVLMTHVAELAERIKYGDAKPLVAEAGERIWLMQLHEVIHESNTQNQFISKAQPIESNVYEQQPQFSEADVPLSGFDQMSISQVSQQDGYHSNKTFPSLASDQSSQSVSQSVPSFLMQPETFLGRKQSKENTGLFPNQYNVTSEYGGSNYSDFSGTNQQTMVNNDMSLGINESVSGSNQPFSNDFNNDTNQGYYSPWDQPQQPVTISTRSNYKNYFDGEDSKTYRITRGGSPSTVVTHPATENTNNRNPEVKSATSNQPPNQSSNDADLGEKKSTENGNSSGWLGGIFGKLSSLRPKNQMILPDDKNPEIVWDKEKKRWVNVNGDDVGEGEELKRPPPTAAELNAMARSQSLNQSNPPANRTTNSSNTKQPSAMDGPPPPYTSNNMYKLPKGKGLKSNYVNIFAQNSNASNMSSQSSLDSSSNNPYPFYVPPSGP